MTSPRDDLRSRAASLTAVVHELSMSIGALSIRIGEQELAGAAQARNLRRQAWVLRLSVIGLAFVVVIGAVLGSVIVQQIALNRGQNQTQNEVLCPLLGLFLTAYHPETRPPEQRDFYNDAFAQIRHMHHDILNCPAVPQ